MSKTKHKKDKVPKITEEEYAAYFSSLRALTEGGNPAMNTDMGTPSKPNTPTKKG